jgi:hypothetical protein
MNVLSDPQAWKLHATNKLMELVDPELHLSDTDEGEDVQRVIKIALMCAQVASDRRPTMARIVSLLQSDTQSDVGVVLGAAAGEQELQQFEMLKWTQTSSGLSPVTEEGGSWCSSCSFSSESQHILRDL